MGAFFKNISIGSQAQVKRVCFLITMFTTTLLLSYTHDIPFDNPSSRYATIDSLVHHQTLEISKSPFAKLTVDKIFLPGKQFSTKPPLLSWLSAGIYGTYTMITKRTLHTHPRETLYLLNLAIGLASTLFLLFFAYKLLLLWTANFNLRVIGFLILALGHLGLSYATTLNNHTPCAAALLAAFYFLYKERYTKRTSDMGLAFAGLLLGCATAFEHGSAVFSASLFLYAYSSAPKRTLSFLLPCALLPMLINSYLNHLMLGTWLPVQMQPELYSATENYWHNQKQQMIDATQPPKWRYIFNLLIGHHGIFSFNPILLFALPALYGALRKRTSCFHEALAISASLCIMLGYYSLRTHNYGGICTGARWFILLLPMLVLFVLRFMEERRSLTTWTVLWLSIGVSIYNTVGAMDSPWQLSKWYTYFVSFGWT